MSNVSVTVDAVIVSDELARRPNRPRDYAAENRALVTLSREINHHPQRALQTLAELVLELCGADSAGISIPAPGSEHGMLRWDAVAGTFAENHCHTMPGEAGPCAIAMARNRVMLFDAPDRYFPSLRGLTPPIHEYLSAPWSVNGKPAGTLWAIGHSPGKRFDGEDARLLQSLATFGALAQQMIVTRDQATAGQPGLEAQVAGRTHLLSETNRLLEQEIAQRRQVEAALRESQQRQAFLLRLNDVLRSLTDPIEIQSEVARLLGEHLGANRVLIAEFHGDQVIVQRDYVSGLPSMAGRYLMASFGTAHIKAYERGEPFVIDDLGADARLTETDRTPFVEAGIAAAIGVGMIRNGQVVAAFGIHSKTPRHWTDAEIGLAREVAEHARGALERARAEEALKKADRRKDEFLATLAHELRNPLAPISNAVQLLRQSADKQRAEPLVEMIGRQVHQIVKLVDDLLEISRISRGKIQLDKQAVSLRDVVDNAVESSRPLIDGARHQLTVSLPDEPVVLEADGVRLTQVLTNLLNNAAKYTDAGGTIWLSARPDGGDVVISVRDSGIGIPGNQLPNVFEMFTQLHRTDGRSQGGLGIGLTMVRDLVRMHGGVAEARSAGPGQGSEFLVRLPMLQASPANADMAAAAATGTPWTEAPLSGQRILVVDDNRDAADSLAMLLEANGAEVKTAYGGDLALATLDSMRPTSILLDLGMPGKDGYQVAREIRQDSRFEGVRIIALTGWGQETDRNRTRQFGFDCHLTKPVDFGELESWLNGA